MRRKWIFQLIGVLIFVIILFKLNLRTVLSELSGANLALLLAAVFLTIPFVTFKAWRWKCLLDMQGIEYDFKNSFLAYLGSMYMGLVTPGRLGDFIKVIYLKKDKGISIGRGFSGVLVDRLFDLLVLISMATAGALALTLSMNMITVILSFLVLLVLIVFIFLNEKIGKRLIGILFRVVLPSRQVEKTDALFENFYAGIKELRSVKLFFPLGLSLLSYLLFYIQCFLITRSLHIPIDFLNVAFCISTANLVSLLPLSISGIGTRDATLISLFSLLNLSQESALSFSLMFLFISNISSCLIGVGAWLKKPVDFKV
ncbi:MAG: flippase-like domain-containing protein [Candidatus Krumholzibacteriota bacterium]|nr:flippase-like domain-containing protein [Candidatus Krumholzibacteriota bacterium]